MFKWRRVQNDKDGDWVTVEFEERPGAGGLIVDLAGSDPRTRIQSRYEEIRARADYRNYRRFQVKIVIR